MDTTPAKRRPFRGRLVHVPPPSAARRRAGPLALLASVAALALTAAPAQAASPQITATWVTDVTGTSVNFHAEVNPEGLTTTYRFEYITGAKYQANPPGEPFAGAAKAPPGPEAFLGSGATVQPVFQHAGGLASSTVFHYRISATNTGIGGGTTTSSPKTFTTQESTGAFSLLDQRGWEIVSPLGKNGGAIQSFGQNFGGGVLQAAAGGGAITYSSASSFGEAPQGAPPASQYISRRAAGEGGWSTENITTPALSGSYGTEPNGVPYQLFSPDLARGLLLNGEPCRGEGEGCPVANPPLPGTKAPAGYQDYYLRDNENGSFTAVLTDANSELALAPEEFSLAFAGASPDLRHAILSTCAALTPGASEVAGSEGCDPTKPNLYQYEEGQLKLVNTAPGAKLAAQGAAVSSDGFRVYFTEEGLSEEVLWLREGAAAPHELAEGAKFQTATPSGAFAFFTKAGHLSRYDAATHTATDLTPSGGVVGVLGASEDGSRVYFATAAGIFSWHSGTTATVTAAPGAAQASDYPPTAGTARVSADGTRLLFLSAASLTGYDNTDASSGQPDTEVYLFEAEPTELTCISCNPTGERPLGPSSIPGAIANPTAAASSSTPPTPSCLPTPTTAPTSMSGRPRARAAARGWAAVSA